MELSGQKSNRWREYCNPLRGLSVPRVASLLEAGERGEFADLQWFYHYMERSDPMIFSILQRRRSALLESDWDIRQAPGDDVLAEEQAAFLREAYDGVENFREAVGFLASGVFRGYAHLEKHWGADGLVERLEPVEQWFWVRDGMFGEWEYNRDAISGRRRGEPIELDDFVIFESPALNRMLAVLYLRRNLSQRDWDSYLDVYGIPSIFMVGPPNMPEAKEAEYQEIAKSMISDGRGYLPNGSDVKYVNGGGGKLPFLEHLEYLDRQITIVGTGGLLTMLAEPGSGTLAGGAHTEAFRQIARGDAAVLSEAFQRDFDTPLLAQAFGDRTPLAYFQFSPPTEGNPSKVVDDAVKLAGAGYPVQADEVSEKTGYQIET
jgi:phage gp29-like protein